MVEKTHFDEFMLKEYEEAWGYIRYTYDMSNKILAYIFAIIIVVGVVASRALVKTITIKEVIDKSEKSTTQTILIDPSMLEPDVANLLGAFFIGLCVIGFFMHGFYVFQRVIIDRQIRVLDDVREYFSEQAKKEGVPLEQYLYFRKLAKYKESLRKRKVSIPTGSVDLIAQFRLILPAFVNALTFTLAIVLFRHMAWDISGLLVLYFGFLAFSWLVNNLTLAKLAAKQHLLPG